MSVSSGQYYDDVFICASSASLATNQYCLVSFTTATTQGGRPGIVLCTGTSFGLGGPSGVLQDAPAASRAGTVRMLGLGSSRVVASSTGSINLGDPITSTTWGTAVTAGTTGQRVIGTAISASTGVAGSLIEVLLNGPYSFTL